MLREYMSAIWQNDPRRHYDGMGEGGGDFGPMTAPLFQNQRGTPAPYGDNSPCNLPSKDDCK